MKTLARWAVLPCLLVAGLALGQIAANAPVIRTPGGAGNWLARSPQQATAAVKYWIDPANGGVDTNSCLSAAAPCATFQGVERKLPKYLPFPAEVIADAGTYAACSTWDGFVFTSDQLGNTAGALWVHGIQVPATVTGLQTGTVASATEFVATSPPAQPTITVTGAGWVVNALRGLYLHITGGTGKGETLLIAGNTATVITIAGGYATSTAAWINDSIYTGNMTNPFAEFVKVDATSTFEILKNGTSITGGCQFPYGPAANGVDGGFVGSYGNLANNTYNLQVTGMRGVASTGPFVGQIEQVASPNTPVVFSDLDFNDGTSTNVYVANSDSVELRRLSFTNGYSADIQINNVARMSMLQNSNINPNNQMIHIVPDTQYGTTLLECGDVIGNATNTKGYWYYDAYANVPGPRFWYICLNDIRLSGSPHTAIEARQPSLFKLFGNWISGFQVTGVSLAGPGYAEVQSNNIVGAAGADSAIQIGNGGMRFSSTGNSGSTGQKYGFRLGGGINEFSPSINNINDALSGTIADVALSTSGSSLHTESISNITAVNSPNNNWGIFLGTPAVFSGDGVNIFDGDAGFKANLIVYGGKTSTGASGNTNEAFQDLADAGIYGNLNLWGDAGFLGGLAVGRLFTVPNLPTTSLPTCNAGAVGGVTWDTTTSTFKTCDGSSWKSIPNAPADWALAIPTNQTTGTGIIQQITTTSAGTYRSANFATDITGVGAGNFVLKLCSDGATCAAGNTFTTCTIACAAAADTNTSCTAGAKTTYAAATTISLSISTACGTTNQVGSFLADLTTP